MHHVTPETFIKCFEYHEHGTLHIWFLGAESAGTASWKGMQGRATEARNQPELTEATLKRSLADMERKVKETRKQVNGLDAALSELDMQRNLLVEQITAASQACGQARQQEGILRTSIEASLTEKHKVSTPVWKTLQSWRATCVFGNLMSVKMVASTGKPAKSLTSSC